MATALSVVAPFAAGGNLGFRRISRRVAQVAPPLFIIDSSARRRFGFSSCSLINARFSLRFTNVVKLCKMHRGPIFASETNESKLARSVGTDSPPLVTILAGIVVFLLFAWLIGSVVLWIFGLIVNVPKS